MTLDLELLTLDEVEQIELISGLSIDEVLRRGKPKGRALKALIFVFTKRTNPEFTLDEAGKMTFDQATELLNGAGNDPKE